LAQTTPSPTSKGKFSLLLNDQPLINLFCTHRESASACGHYAFHMGQNDLQPVTNFDDSLDQPMFVKPVKMNNTFTARPDIWVSKAGQERQTLRNTELIATSSAKITDNCMQAA